jgi:hypothetical protein
VGVRAIEEAGRTAGRSVSRISGFLTRLDLPCGDDDSSKVIKIGANEEAVKDCFVCSTTRMERETSKAGATY